MNYQATINRLFILILGAILVVGFASCDDAEETIVVNSILEEAPNSPPRIILQGPDYASGSLELIAFDTPPEFFVLVADADGLEDISTVFFGIDSLIVYDVIVRPDSSSSASNRCDHAPSYANPDTINIMPLIPSVFPGVKNIPMEPLLGSYYMSPPLCRTRSGFEQFPCPTFPNISEASSTFSRPSKCVGFGIDYFHFVINPPAPDTAIDVFVTYVDVEYAGISVTVYDAAGASATTTFPNLRIVYTTEQEKLNAP